MTSDHVHMRKTAANVINIPGSERSTIMQTIDGLETVVKEHPFLSGLDPKSHDFFYDCASIRRFASQWSPSRASAPEMLSAGLGFFDPINGTSPPQLASRRRPSLSTRRLYAQKLSTTVNSMMNCSH